MQSALMGSGHIKVKKWTHHLFHMAIPCHTIESACLKVALYSETCLVFVFNPHTGFRGLFRPQKDVIVNIFQVGFT